MIYNNNFGKDSFRFKILLTIYPFTKFYIVVIINLITMKKYFKNDQTNQHFLNWIINHPESDHGNDRSRFYELIYSLLETGEELTEEILTDALSSEKEWIEEYRNEFVDSYLDKYFLIKDYVGYLILTGKN